MSTVRRATVRVAANSAGETGVRTRTVRVKGASKVVWTLRATNTVAPSAVALFVTNDKGASVASANFRAVAAAEGVIVGTPTGVGDLSKGGLIIEMWPEFVGYAGVGCEQAELRFSTTTGVTGLEVEVAVYDSGASEVTSEAMLSS